MSFTNEILALEMLAKRPDLSGYGLLQRLMNDLPKLNERLYLLFEGDDVFLGLRMPDGTSSKFGAALRHHLLENGMSESEYLSHLEGLKASLHLWDLYDGMVRLPNGNILLDKASIKTLMSSCEEDRKLLSDYGVDLGAEEWTVRRYMGVHWSIAHAPGTSSGILVLANDPEVFMAIANNNQISPFEIVACTSNTMRVHIKDEKEFLECENSPFILVLTGSAQNILSCYLLDKNKMFTTSHE